MDRILIKNLRVQGVLGVNDWERTTLREIVVNVILFTDTRRTTQSDDIANCIDYSQVVKNIRSLIEKKTAISSGSTGRGYCQYMPQQAGGSESNDKS
jgi:FolB domain-containing protein